MKQVFWIAALSCAASSALAEPVNLTCSGTVHQYILPTVREAFLAPAAAQVDLETFTITTPLGHYHITETDEILVTFTGQPSNGYVITGTLDRSSGRMNIRWLSEHEQAELADSIAQLIEENEKLRRVAALLTSQIEVMRGSIKEEDQPTSMRRVSTLR